MRRQTGLNATLCRAVSVMPKQPLTCGSTVTSITTNVSPPSQLISPCQSRSDGGSASAAGKQESPVAVNAAMLSKNAASGARRPESTKGSAPTAARYSHASTAKQAPSPSRSGRRCARPSQ